MGMGKWAFPQATALVWTIYNLVALTCFKGQLDCGTRKKSLTLTQVSVWMVGCGDIQRAQIKMGHLSTSEGKSERTG